MQGFGRTISRPLLCLSAPFPLLRGAAGGFDDDLVECRGIAEGVAGVDHVPVHGVFAEVVQEVEGVVAALFRGFDLGEGGGAGGDDVAGEEFGEGHGDELGVGLVLAVVLSCS